MLILAAVYRSSSGIYGLNVSVGAPEDVSNLCLILKTVMKIVPKFPSWRLVRLQTKLKLEEKKLHKVLLLLLFKYSYVLVISWFRLKCRLLKTLISACLQNRVFYLILLLGGGGGGYSSAALPLGAIISVRMERVNTRHVLFTTILQRTVAFPTHSGYEK